MNIKPLSDRVVVKSVEAEEKTKTGIFLTASAQEKPQVAEVVAVGPGARDDNGKLIPMEVKVGDKVITGKYSGTEVKMDGTEYTIVKQSDILAIVD
ncbi:MAG: co-chaperone GroES [Clostridia bacterium]|jgi:chaperonin GroES|nr:co-chaperone GroES [Clostridia bacterium]